MLAEVCLTPELIHQHELEGKIAVVIDIFRATSCIVTGLNEGVDAIYPVETVEECLALGEQGMVTAGERGGKKIEKFDIGNSPFSYREAHLKGQKVAISTTNGTLAIKRSLAASEVIIGSFLNLSITLEYLQKKDMPVVFHCAGWKGTPNIEDTLYAGAAIYHGSFDVQGDSALMARDLYSNHQGDLLAVASRSGHAERLCGFGVKGDIEFCLTSDVYQSVIRLEEDHLIRI